MQQSVMDEKERISETEIIVKSVWGNKHFTSQSLSSGGSRAGGGEIGETE